MLRLRLFTYLYIYIYIYAPIFYISLCTFIFLHKHLEHGRLDLLLLKELGRCRILTWDCAENTKDLSQKLLRATGWS